MAASRSSCPALPVLYMSGYAGTVVVANGTLEEAACCITKPFTVETLLDGVAKLLGLNKRTETSGPTVPGSPVKRCRS